MKEVLEQALDAAVAAGAEYADVRGVQMQSESLSVNGPSVEALDRSESGGFGVRVLVDGAWGYASSAGLDDAEAGRVAALAVDVGRASAMHAAQRVELVDEPVHVDTWSTPIETDPFDVPLEDKVGVLTEATGEMERVNGVRVARGTMDLLRYTQTFLSSEGSSIVQTIWHTGAGIEATAVADGEVQVRSYPGSFRGHFGASGYESVIAMDLPGHAQQTAEEAVALLSAEECPATQTTLVIDGHQAMLQVHESIGHPTELDRVLGMEAAFAGTSFVGLEDVGRLRYGSDVVNITADATVPGGLGSFACDDEGVAAQKVFLVENGILVGFQTSRETAAAAGADRSNGTMRAEGWENFPLIRMTNINLLPGEGTLDDLLADVDDGIFMATNKSWSIDDKRKNFQFGCEIGYRIEHGRLTKMLKNPRYTGITPEFWGACDAVAGPEEWKVWGTPNCGKGQPGQSMRVGHGTSPRSVPACEHRGRSLNVLVTEEEARLAAQPVLELPGADGVEVVVSSSSIGLTRYALSRIVQNTVRNEVHAHVRVVVGDRAAQASTNQLDREHVTRAAQRALEAARSSPPDDDFPGLPHPDEVGRAEPTLRWDEATAGAPPGFRADAVGDILEGTSPASAAGIYETSRHTYGVFSSTGIGCYDAFTRCVTTCLVDTGQATGWAEASSHRADEVDVARVAARAKAKAEAGSGAVDAEPGLYEVVLEAPAVATFLDFLSYTSFSAKGVIEGESFLATRSGQEVAAPGITIADDVRDPLSVGVGFDLEGVPKRRVAVIQDGRAVGPVTDLRTARKLGSEVTGHGSGSAEFGPFAANVTLAPGDQTEEELVGAVDDGFLVTRFHYTNVLDRPTVLLTGMTRDGIFRIRRGEVAEPVHNFRFAQSALDAFASVRGIGKKRVAFAPDYGSYGSTVAAPVHVGEFRFASRTSH